ncbi:hypothetical protein SEA_LITTLEMUNCHKIN_82 [Gordonia phage LittleMunchkin]|nr:hypothetical protein SEA_LITTLEMUNCHKIN_82 [Gordonia phage LittleMunchkin]
MSRKPDGADRMVVADVAPVYRPHTTPT